MLEPVEDALPERGQDALTDGPDLIHLPARRERPDDVDPEQQEHSVEEAGRIVLEDEAVYGDPDQPRTARLGERAEDDET